MNANALNFDLYALTSPKSVEDLIALAAEARTELARINRFLDRMFEECETPADA